ncbi:hypothetical protein CYMTET_50906 [Cymbomonas tetramitiformis]|uniref:Uncharacterized protein n=1 Tax=Cymbomonas tetramitiformis TaxID=36881 RepID=A0AAE0BNA0_9CHLO|nr:hypothetical protein CYMTET_50906 [Cymbomonas tetramitiformis]
MSEPTRDLLSGRCWWCISRPLWRPGEVLQQLRRLVELLASEIGGPCQYRRGTQHVIASCCLECSRLLCQACGGVSVGLTGFVRCSRCLVISVGIVQSGGSLTLLLRVYFQLQRTEEGVAVQWLEPPDPMQPYVMVVRTDGELSPYVRGYLIMDKNVDLRKPRKFYLPAEVPALGLLPVEELEDYIVASGLPSGSRLFSAPNGATGWHYTPYRGHGRAFKRAYARAFPEAADGHLYGSGSARKSLGQWLWTWGWSHRMISDVGGWYTPKVAMDLYFATHRATVLRALAQLGAEGPAVTAAHWD